MTRIAAAVKQHPVVAYFAVAFALTWALWVPMAIGGATVVQGTGWPTHVPGLFGPALAAFLVAALAGGRSSVADLLNGIRRWKLRPRWYAVALSPLALYAVAAAFIALTTHAWPDPGE